MRQVCCKCYGLPEIVNCLVWYYINNFIGSLYILFSYLFTCSFFKCTWKQYSGNVSEKTLHLMISFSVQSNENFLTRTRSFNLNRPVFKCFTDLNLRRMYNYWNPQILFTFDKTSISLLQTCYSKKSNMKQLLIAS